MFLFHLTARWQADLDKPDRCGDPLGLFRFFGTLVIIFVIAPPLVVLLAAFWLEKLERIDNSTMQTLRDTYIEIINKGFSVEKVASRSNIRLDYLQPFDADLTQKNQHKTIRISIQPRQKAELRFGLITYKSDSENCSIPEDDLQLASVFLDNELIAKLSQEDSQKSVPISENWWRSHQDLIPSESLTRLSFKLVAEIAERSCGRVHIDGTFSVFKDIMQPLSQER